MTPRIYNFAKLVSSLASFAVAKTMDPDGCLGEIIMAITGNLASNFIAKYDPVALIEHIDTTASEPDNEIKKLMIDSLPKAVKRVAEKYLLENENANEFVRTILNSLIDDVKNINYSETDNLKMTIDQNSWLEDIHECIFKGYEDENGQLGKIEKYFATHLQECYYLEFIQGLLNENNEKPLKAFLIKSLEGLSKQLTDNAIVLASIKSEIQSLKQDKSGKALPTAKKYLREQFDKINQKLDKLLEENQLTNEGINHLKQGQKEFKEIIEKIINHSNKSELQIIVLTSTKNDIKEIEYYNEIIDLYGIYPNEWKPFKDEESIENLLKFYEQKSGINVQVNIISEDMLLDIEFEDMAYIIDDIAPQIVLISDGISILKTHNNIFRKITDQKNIGGFLLPICEKTYSNKTREFLIDSFKTQLEPTCSRFYKNWRTAYINIELAIPSKEIFFRRLTNIAYHSLKISITANVDFFRKYKKDSAINETKASL